MGAMGLELMGPLEPPSTVMSRLAIAPSVPSPGWRPVTPDKSIVGTIPKAILANVGREAGASVAPQNNNYPAVGSPGTAGNAGNIGGAQGNVGYAAGITLPLLGQVNPLWLAAGAAVVLFLVLKD